MVKFVGHVNGKSYDPIRGLQIKKFSMIESCKPASWSTINRDTQIQTLIDEKQNRTEIKNRDSRTRKTKQVG